VSNVEETCAVDVGVTRKTAETRLETVKSKCVQEGQEGHLVDATICPAARTAVSSGAAIQ